METPIQFDLGIAFHNWREKLAHSPNFRKENLDELESHLRDSVNALQSKGLSADEAFLIGIRRIGTADVLEGQFAAENGGRGWRHVLRRLVHNYGNKTLHGLILVWFTVVCWLFWGCLRVSQMMEVVQARMHEKPWPTDHVPVPGFTQMMWDIMPYWYVLPDWRPFTAALCGRAKLPRKCRGSLFSRSRQPF
ncbi:MAG TPA: permease prefix domain 1-containing protein [Verrucomicrobiae bacterium]|nr:permease prefix domain 1-containing protein [Verrucomicrobiae bacterium]